jgi:glycosyltransferase involved in cell wall biosynthesis
MVGPYKAAGIRLIQGSQGRHSDPEKVRQADLVLIQRDFPIQMQAYERILSLARLQSKPVVVDYDDRLLGLPPEHPDRLSHYYARALFPILRSFLEADAVTAVSATLGQSIQSLNPNIWVLPNYLNDEYWDLSPVADEIEDGVVTLGYMGGDSHSPDIETLVPLLAELLQQYSGRLRLKLVGMSPFSELKDHPLVEWIPFRLNYADYTAFVRRQNFDLMIAPMQDIPFNRSKGSIKFLEYGALSLPGVFSDTLPFNEQVSHAQDGFLASSQDEWRSYLVMLIEDQALRRQIGLAANRTVRERWLLSAHAHEWVDVYQQVISRRGQSHPAFTLPVDLFTDLSRQTQEWQQALEEQLADAHRRLDQQQAALTEKEQYITTLDNQLQIYRDGAPGKLIRLARRIFSPLTSRRSG